MKVILYYHPDYWRVQSVAITQAKDYAQTLAKLKKEGNTITTTASISCPLSMFRLGCKCRDDAGAKILKALAGDKNKACFIIANL